MDDRILPGAVVIGVLLLLLTLMVLGWRRRQRGQSDLPRPLAVPHDAGDETLRLDALYVASTRADDPLDRIAVAGLGYRARATVVVRERGIQLALAGEPDAYIPAEHVRFVTRATWTVDRVVETDGLVVISWLLGDTPIDTYLRMSDATAPSALLSAIDSIIEAPGATPGRNEES